MSGHHQPQNGNPAIRFLIDNSLLLIIGTLIALTWANAAHVNDSDSYDRFVNFDLASL